MVRRAYYNVQMGKYENGQMKTAEGSEEEMQVEKLMEVIELIEGMRLTS